MVRLLGALYGVGTLALCLASQRYLASHRTRCKYRRAHKASLRISHPKSLFIHTEPRSHSTNIDIRKPSCLYINHILFLSTSFFILQLSVYLSISYCTITFRRLKFILYTSKFFCVINLSLSFSNRPPLQTSFFRPFQPVWINF